jgi:DNA-binding LacI/PurR family transcriptional regulator
LKLNIYDIAEEAGVSIATVSRVLNNAPRVRHKTRQKILDIMESKNYTPKLMSNRLTNITVLIRGYSISGRWCHFGSYESQILNGITKTCHRHTGINLQVFPYHTDLPDEHIVKHLQGNKTDGALLISSADIRSLDVLLQASNIKTFYCNTMSEQGNHIIVDNKKGTEDMLYQLYQQGHRRIAYFGYESQSWSEKERLESWRAFMKKMKIDDPNLEILHKSSSNMEQGGFAVGYQLTEQLLKIERGRPTAVFALNSEFAGGLMKALNQAEIKVPKAMSVVTYDDFPYLEYITPSISTISQPLYQLGEACAEQLIKNIKDEAGDYAKLLSPTLCMRESTGPAPL